MKDGLILHSLLKHGRFTGLLALLVALFVIPSTSYAQGPITVRFSGDGNYATIASGVGLVGNTSGDITLTVPGTPVVAFLYWSGYGTLATGGDSLVELDVNSISVSTDVYADTAGLGLEVATFGPSLWFSNLYRTVYVADVTRFVQSGTAIYRIQSFALTGIGGRHDGAGLVVVYENPAGPYSRVIIQDGLSIFFPASNPPQTFRHSDTACLDFPADTAARALDYSLFVGGLVQEIQPELPRTNALWSYTGTGTALHNEVPFRNIIDVVDPTNSLLGSTMPLGGAIPISGVNPADPNDPDESAPTFGANIAPNVHNGDQWDSYTNTLNIPAGQTFACFQIQTFNYNGTNALGSSGNWIMLTGLIPLPTEAPILTPPPATTAPTTSQTDVAQASSLVPTVQAGEPSFPTRLPATGYPSTDRIGWLVLLGGGLLVVIALATLRRPH